LFDLQPTDKREEDVLRWLAKEYGLTRSYTTLDDVEPDRELLSLFPRAFC
jgi:hypothetical protein